jgi:dCTP deaminase
MYSQGEISLSPFDWFAVATKERIKLGRKLCGQLWLRSTWIRKGIIASFGKVDAGFEGSLTLTAFNASSKYLVISIGDTFVQIVFEELSTDADSSYGERSGKYQGQTGIILE